MKGRRALRGCAVAVALALGAQEPLEYGPFPTREMFPLFLPTLAYQPVDPTPLGEGRWRVSLDHVRANTFEFSDLLKEESPRDIQGRIRVTREGAQELAAQHPSTSLIFYFDEEIVRTTLRLRYGLGGRTFGPNCPSSGTGEATWTGSLRASTSWVSNSSAGISSKGIG